MRKYQAVWLFLAVAAAVPAGAENWPQWRGPFFNGSTTEKDLPVKWSKTENVAWKAQLPGIGGATPIIWGDRVFISAMEAKAKRSWAVCLSRADGKILWKHQIGGGFTNRQGNTAASASAITDGKSVWFFFGTGDFVAFDMNGRQIWRRDITADHGQFEMLWKFGATPLLYKGRLYLAVLHGHHRRLTVAKSYLLCIDPATGKDLWKHIRYTEAKAESKQAYTTPYPFEGPKGLRIVVVGGDRMTAHDPDTGKEIWRSMSYNPQKDRWLRTVPSAVAAAGVVWVGGPKGEPMFAVKAGGTGRLTAADNAWLEKKNSPDVCTPAVYGGRFYILDGRLKVILCKDPKTGKTFWKGKLGGLRAFQASPTAADGKIYCMRLDGEVVILAAGDEFKVLNRINMEGKNCQATIVPAGGQLFVRVDDVLYCIGRRRN